MTADPFLMAAGEPGALHPSGPLQGHLAETGFKCPGGEVVADENRAGLAVEPAPQSLPLKRSQLGIRPQLDQQAGAAAQDRRRGTRALGQRRLEQRVCVQPR